MACSAPTRPVAGKPVSCPADGAPAPFTTRMAAMSSSMTEIEFKFDIPRASLPALEAALRGPGSRRTHLQARYFDTPQDDLAAHGVALRLRKEGPRWVQTAKALGDGPVLRLEQNVDLGTARKSAP